MDSWRDRTDHSPLTQKTSWLSIRVNAPIQAKPVRYAVKSFSKMFPSPALRVGFRIPTSPMPPNTFKLVSDVRISSAPPASTAVATTAHMYTVHCLPHRPSPASVPKRSGLPPRTIFGLIPRRRARSRNTSLDTTCIRSFAL